MDEFEQLLECDRAAVERFVRYRVSMVHDADDILQEIYITAYSKFPQLKNKESFKPWIISIARNKCTDYFHRVAKQYEIPIDNVAESELSYGRRGVSESIRCARLWKCSETATSRYCTSISGRSSRRLR